VPRRLLGVVLPLVPNAGAADVVTPPLPASIEEIDPFDARDPCTVSSLCIICVSLSSRSLRCPSAPPSSGRVHLHLRCFCSGVDRLGPPNPQRSVPNQEIRKENARIFRIFRFRHADVVPKPTWPDPTGEGPSGRVGLLSTVALSYLNACSLSRTTASFSSSLA
jgi:hypothetical protein